MNLLRHALFVIALHLVVSTTQAQVFLTKDQALNLFCGKESVKEYEPKQMTASLREELVGKGLWGEDKEAVHFFRCVNGGVTSGYVLIDSEIGKHQPITYAVGLTPDGAVSRVEMMVFREVRGWEARDPRFVDQFKGRRAVEELSAGRAIKSVTGATLSSWALKKGVGRALVLWKHFYGNT